MTRHVILVTCLLLSQLGAAQLQNINFRYAYDPEAPYQLLLHSSRLWMDSLQVSYFIQFREGFLPDTSTITWEKRLNRSQKSGEVIYPKIKKITNSGVAQFTIPYFSGYLVASVVYQQQTRVYFINTETAASFTATAEFYNQKFISTGQRLQISPDRAIGFLYKTSFPSASPPFAESQMAVSETLKPDSTFKVDQFFEPTREGLYLLQHDTSTQNGFAFRAVADYPKFSTLQNLVGPLTYITTRSESQQLLNAQRDKLSFDKIILRITGNADRAKLFMRNYFKRVEYANRFFTSYKEGWKTDRGMIYIVYGVPDYVYLFDQREVWEYTPVGREKVSFTFVRSSTVFDPDHAVLIRKRNYQSNWLEAVDLVRNARF